jgi:hypothetical protein
VRGGRGEGRNEKEKEVVKVVSGTNASLLLSSYVSVVMEAQSVERCPPRLIQRCHAIGTWN